MKHKLELKLVAMTLSQDNLFEILSWLPSKVINRFNSISESFSNISNGTYFALKQSQNMLMKGDTGLFIQLDTVQQYNGEIELCSLPNERQFSGVSNDVLGFLSRGTRVLDSYNGLILCRSTDKNPIELFVCNPSTKSWLSTPILEHLQQNPNANFKVMLECGEDFFDSDDYKVIHFESSSEWESSSYYICNVFHAKDGVWKTMETPFFVGPRNMKFDMPVHYNGSLHFISDCFPYFVRNTPYFRPYIMSYNLKNGTSSMLKVPNEARRGSHDRNCEMSIFKWSNISSSMPQSICLVRLKKSVFTIWVLRDYESSSWYKIMKVRVKALGVKEKDPIVTGFTVMNGDVLIFVVGKNIYSCGLSGEIYMKLEEIGELRFASRICFTSYSNTLRPCGKGASPINMFC